MRGHDPALVPAVACRDVRVAYDRSVAVDGVTIDVAAGELVALLGPSGSGKTTLLSAIAGFLPVSGGEIVLDGRVASGPRRHDPPERRHIGYVFQGHALWPHLSAQDTVAYPLRRQGLDRSEARREAWALLDRLGIGGLAARRPAELSGGEHQRVGLGRALARRARVLLFDEPTANLDAELRATLQEEIAVQRRESGAAALYATHDTAEALALADRVVLMDEGRITHSWEMSLPRSDRAPSRPEVAGARTEILDALGVRPLSPNPKRNPLNKQGAA